MTARKHVPGEDSRYSPPSLGWVPCSRRIPIFWDDFAHYLNLVWAHIEAQDKKINRMEKVIMASQADIDALTAALAQEDSDLNTAVAGIQAEIAALQAANPALDVSALSAQVDAMRGAVDSAAALVPAPPAPPAV